MKKITTLFLGAVALSCLSMATVGITSPVSANEQSAENITWNDSELYVTESVAEEMPKTFEAWLKLDTTSPAVAGTVFGNYGACKPFGRYEVISEDMINLEISTKGNPRLYVQTPNGEGEVALFGNVDVRSSQFVHLAVSYDGEKAYCYLNGELKDTVDFVVDEFVSAYEYAVGGDYRTNAGTYSNYFQGEIRSVAAYADVRTESEITADMTSVSAADDKLILAYDLAGKAGADEISDISANGNDLVRTWLWSETIPQNDYAYSMVAIGDTQKANIYGKEDCSGINFDAIYDHIVANAEEDKMKFVFGLGDITDESRIWEFDKAKKNIEKLDGVVPYSLVRGNHDYAKIADVPASVATTKSSFEATWGVNSGSTYNQQYFATYDDTALHTAHKFSVGNLDYLVVVLSWAPSDEAIAWANDIVAAHPYHNVIVTTHGFTDANGEILEYWSDKGKNYADKIWDNFIKKHENITLVLSGHITSQRIEHYTLEGEKGNTVTQLLIDPSWLDTDMQGTNPKGAGLIANLCFSEDGSQVDVNWYSPIQQKYYNSASVYSITIDTVARQQLDVSVKGNGGKATPASTEINGEPIKITFTPNKNHHLSKLTLDGEDVTASVENNVYILTKTSGEMKLVAEFVEDDKYAVAVQDENEKGTVAWNSAEKKYFQGEEVSWTVTPKAGWKVVSVSFNGNVIKQNADGTYTATVEGKDNVVAVEYEEVSVDPITLVLENNGGSWTVGIVLSAIGVVALGGVAVFVFVIKKRED